MCRGREMYAYTIVTGAGASLMIMTWNNTWKHSFFFQRPAAFFLEHTQDFLLSRDQWRNLGEGAKGLQPL